LSKTMLIVLFQPVTISYLALGDLVPFFTEDPVGEGRFALLMQHSEADLFLDGEGDGSNRNVDRPMLIMPDQVGWLGRRSRGSSSLVSSAMSGGFSLGIYR
jgi:hypothetical protein